VRQARSQQTLERLLDSAEALIGEKGFADAPVAEIARRAGFSVGAFYSRFRDKEALLHCLQGRLFDEAVATADATLDPGRWRGAGLVDVACELVAFLVEIHRERAGILREVVVRAPTDARIDARKEALLKHISDRLQPLLLERVDEIRHPDPDAAARFAFRVVLGVLKEAILFAGPAAHGIPRSDASLSEELSRVFLAYLGVRLPLRTRRGGEAEPRRHGERSTEWRSNSPR
jgi:AcrR family transcriptional regulator